MKGQGFTLSAQLGKQTRFIQELWELNHNIPEGCPIEEAVRSRLTREA
jgi:hypothetical protein